MIDLKVMHAVLGQLEEERGVKKEQIFSAIEAALATAYKKEYGKRGQIVTAKLDGDSGSTEFFQVKTVITEESVVFTSEDEEGNIIVPEQDVPEEEKLPVFNPEQHIMLEDAKRIKKDATVGDEITFPLKPQADFGRIASQTAKQVIIQKLREAERESVAAEYGEREGEIITGTVQRIDRGTIYVDLGRATAIIPWDEQIPKENYKQGERIRAYLFRVDEGKRGSFLKLSRSHPMFLQKLFEQEVPEIAASTVEIMGIAREPGSRSKISVVSHDEHVDPVGALVGQHGVRVKTVTTELGGERIDIIEWNEDPAEYIIDALAPAEIVEIAADDENKQATVYVKEDQQSLAIGRGGQNVRLAARLTGWRIDITQDGEESSDDKDAEESTDKSETEGPGEETLDEIANDIVETEKKDSVEEETTEESAEADDDTNNDSDDAAEENTETAEITEESNEDAGETTDN
jgi:N utilization substance protein A